MTYTMAPTHSTAFLLFFFAILLSLSVCDKPKKYYSSARIESCGGCSLERLPDVKKFIFQDVPKYDNVEFKHIQGAIPELVLFDETDEEVERLPLSRLTREECNELLVSKGFTRKPQKDDL